MDRTFRERVRRHDAPIEPVRLPDPSLAPDGFRLPQVRLPTFNYPVLARTGIIFSYRPPGPPGHPVRSGFGEDGRASSGTRVYVLALDLKTANRGRLRLSARVSPPTSAADWRAALFVMMGSRYLALILGVTAANAAQALFTRTSEMSQSFLFDWTTEQQGTIGVGQSCFAYT
jgi:hypothetical protein